MAIMQDIDRYEFIRDIGHGGFAETRLMRDKFTKELVAVKFIKRGEKVNTNIQREIINHRSLKHPNIINFKKVFLTPTHLAIVMEYASGGDLFSRVSNHDLGQLTEDEARVFFRQIISGISYCHDMQVCHRDLKLENLLVDGSREQRLKICDFGFSKSYVYNSAPNSLVGTPAYIAPEVLLVKHIKEYDGKAADVWSCGVTLYIMLAGFFPFEDLKDRDNFAKIVHRILNVRYTIPKNLCLSPECCDLISRTFVKDPKKRITIPEIKKHAWFRKNLPSELKDENSVTNKFEEAEEPMQSVDTIMQIIKEAKLPAPVGKIGLYNRCKHTRHFSF